MEAAEVEGAERAGAGAVAVAEAREERVARYEPVRTSVKEGTPAERMGEHSGTKERQGIVGVRRSLKGGETEEAKEEEAREEEAEEEENPSLLRRDIAKNDRQNKLVKRRKRGKRRIGSKIKVVAVAVAVAETRYEVETNVERGSRY